MPLTKICIPMKISIAPPIIVATLEILLPIFLPKINPIKHITRVITPIIKDEAKACKTLYSEMVKPTESASMDVAIP